MDVGSILYGPFRVVDSDNPAVVSIYNTTGGIVSVRVYAGPTS